MLDDDLGDNPEPSRVDARGCAGRRSFAGPQDDNVGGWIRMTSWVIFGCDRRGALKYRGHHLSRQHIIDMIKFLSKEFCVVGRPLGE